MCSIRQCRLGVGGRQLLVGLVWFSLVFVDLGVGFEVCGGGRHVCLVCWVSWVCCLGVIVDVVVYGVSYFVECCVFEVGLFSGGGVVLCFFVVNYVGVEVVLIGVGRAVWDRDHVVGGVLVFVVY